MSFIEDHQLTVEMVVDEVVETRLSWIFSTHGATGEMVLGNVPIVVSKLTGNARFAQCAYVEFASSSFFAHLRRSWNRLVRY